MLRPTHVGAPRRRLFEPLNHHDGDARAACLLLNVGVTRPTGLPRLNAKGASGATFEQRTGTKRLAMLGACSGAVNAYRATRDDEPVGSVMQFDPCAKPSGSTRLIHDSQGERTPSFDEWRAKLTRRGCNEMWHTVPPRPVSIFFAKHGQPRPRRNDFAEPPKPSATLRVKFRLGNAGSQRLLDGCQSRVKAALTHRASHVNETTCYLAGIDHIPTPYKSQLIFLNMVRNRVATFAVRNALPLLRAKPAEEAVEVRERACLSLVTLAYRTSHVDSQ